MKNISYFCSLLALCAWLIFLAACQSQSAPAFDGDQAMAYAEKIMSFGARIPGIAASEKTSEFIQAEVSRYGWTTEFQEFIHQGTNLRNIIVRKPGQPADVIIATHYDTRLFSDQEEDAAMQSLPVPGANDGTSGTAVMLEMARALEKEDIPLWLVFFDGEDQGHINDWEWSVGADYFASQMQTQPKAVVVIDMIGDRDLQIYREKNSDPELTNQIWEAARSLGLEEIIINEEKYSMIDDHLPFIELGIPASLLIDFDYPHWHTQQDTLDKINAESLSAVGQTLLVWLTPYYK